MCVNLKSEEENLVIWDSDAKEIGEDLKQGLAIYLEKMRDSLLSKKLIYEEELGLVSVQ